MSGGGGGSPGVVGAPSERPAASAYGPWMPGVPAGNAGYGSGCMCGAAGIPGDTDAGGAGWCGAGVGRGAGIGSLDCEATIACSTLEGLGEPPGGVRREARGLRSSLTAGAWMLALSAAGGTGGLTLGRARSVGCSIARLRAAESSCRSGRSGAAPAGSALSPNPGPTGALVTSVASIGPSSSVMKPVMPGSAETWVRSAMLSRSSIENSPGSVAVVSQGSLRPSGSNRPLPSS